MASELLRFGVIPPLGGPVDVPDERPVPYEGPEDIDWLSCIIPSDDQKEGSCVARATCCVIEALIRLRCGPTAIPVGFQLDAESLYWAARERFYKDHSDGGLQLTMAAAVAIEDWGIMPADTRIHRVPADIPSIVKALHTAPLIQAHAIGTNWEKEQVGDVGRIPYQDLRGKIVGYHATCLAGYMRRSVNDLILTANSWSPAWKWNGIGVMDWLTWWEGYRYLGDGPYLIEPGIGWQHWNRWEKYIVEDRNVRK